MKNVKSLYVIAVAICLMLPLAAFAQTYDLDIADDLGNLVGNTMTMNLATDPYNTIDGTGQFWLVNPNSTNNVDPDPYGTENLYEIYYSVGDLYHITNFGAWIPASNINIDLTTPYALNNGDAVLVDLTVTVPTSQPEGQYETWVRVYDDEQEVQDSFKLVVIIGVQEDVDIRELSIGGSITPGSGLTQFGSFYVLNPNSVSDNPDPDYPGNCDLFNLRFAAQNFINVSDPSKHIDASHIFVSAPTVFGQTALPDARINQLVSGYEMEIIVWLDVPAGTPPGSYDGQLIVYDDDGWPADVLGLTLTVEESYDLDISDNTGNLVGNWMTFNNLPGTTVNGHFVLINPNNPDLNVDPDIYGNSDLTSIQYFVDDLNHTTNPLEYIPRSNITLSITPPCTLLNGASENIGVSVDIPINQFEGEYTTWVRVIDSITGVGDSFQLRVVVGPQEDIDFVQEKISGDAYIGDTLVFLGQFEIINQDQSQWPWPDPDGPSNNDLYNLRFAVTHLMDSTQPTRTIPPSQVYLALTSAGVATGPVPIDQANINQLALGDTAYGKVWVYLPYGQRAAVYKGTLQVYDDDGWPTDFLGLRLVVAPMNDIDISDNTGNLVGNWMTLHSAPNTTVNGHFIVINPNNPDLNVDPDIYGNTDLFTIYYQADDLNHISNPLQYIPVANITLSITDPDTLLSGGSDMVELSVAIPPDQFEGEYTSWIRVIDRATGVADSFQLRVIVGPQEDIDFVQEDISGSAVVGDTLVLLGQFEIINQDQSQWPWPDPDGPSNNDLYNLRFAVTHLMDSTQPTRTIPPSQVYLALTSSGVATGPVPVDQANINQLALGDTAYGKVWVYLPYGQRAAVYKGTLQVYDDDGWPTDFLGLRLVVEPSYDIDISDNTGNLDANWMTLNNLPNTTVHGHFILINPNNPDLNVDPDIYGNSDLTTIYYNIDNLVHKYSPIYSIPSSAITLSITDPDTLLSGGSDMVDLWVAIPSDQYLGEYEGWVRVIDRATGVADSFQLRVVVGPQEDIDFVQEEISGSGIPGDTLVLLGQFELVNQDASQWPWPDPDGPSNNDLYNLRFAVTHLMDSTQPTRTIPPSQIYLALTSSGVATGPVPIDQANINQLALGDTAYGKVWIYLPYGTRAATYKGTLQVYDDDGWPTDFLGLRFIVNSYYDLDIADNEQNLIGNTMRLAGSMNASTQTGYFRMANPNTAELNVDPDPFGNADFTSFNVTVSNLNYVPVPGSDISYVIPNTAVTVIVPSGLASGDAYNGSVSVAIPSDVRSGVYRGTITVTGVPGTPGTPTDMFTLEVVVGAVDDIDIAEASVSTTGIMMTTVSTPSFTVWSTDAANNPDSYDGPGNTTLYGVNFSVTDLTGPYGAMVIPAANVTFIPSYIDSIQAGTSASAYVKVYIPYGIYTGIYTGLATVQNNTGTTSDTIRINVFVQPYYDFDIADNQANLVANIMHLSGPMNTTRSGYYKAVNPAMESQNVDPDAYGNANLDSFQIHIDTLWYVPSGAEDILYFIPPSAITVNKPTSLGWGMDENCEVTVNIPLNTFSGVYRGNITVTGYPNTPGTTTDVFTLQVSVGPLDDIDISEASVSGSANQGTTANTSNFTVWSTDAEHNPDTDDGPGNTTLYGVTFSAQDLRYSNNTSIFIPASNISFVPSTIDSIRPGQSFSVYAKVNIPFGQLYGTYTGLATATNNTGTTSDTVRIIVTVNPYYDLDISDNQQNLIGNIMRLSGPMNTTRYGTFRMVNPNTAELNVDPDMFGNADFGSFTYSVDTLKYIPYGNEDILYYIPPSAVSLSLPAGLVSGASYDARAQVVIPANTFSGVYQGIVRVIGSPALNTYIDSFVLQVSVGPLDDIDIAEASVSATTNHGTSVWTTPFTVWSTDADLPAHNPDADDGPGNTTLYGITFIAQDLRAGNLLIPAANVSFDPVTIDSLEPGHSVLVRARVNVPYGTYATTYSGLATAINATGTTSDTVRIYVTVLPSYDLDISDNTGNLIQNRMTLSVTPLPNVSYDSAYFIAINPNSAELNVDPDMFGNFDLSNLHWSVDDLIHLTDPLAYIPKESVEVYMPTPDFIASGGSKTYQVKVSVPVFQFNGEYNTWLRVFDNSAGVADSFQLKVVVLPIEDIDIVENQITQNVNTGETLVYIGQYTVVNPTPTNNPDPDYPSNIDLDNLRFTCENLREIGAQARYIPAQNIFIEIVGSSSGPTPVENTYIAELPLGESQDVKVWALIPRGTYATSYRGEMRVLDDDGYPSDVIAIQINVNQYYDLDIADNEQSLIENEMHLAGSMGTNTQTGYFRMINPNTEALNVDPDVFGNADFTSFNLTVTNLNYIPVPGDPVDINYVIPNTAVTVVLPQGLNNGDAYNASVQVAIPTNTFAGTYRGTITVTGVPGSPGTPTDMFTLEVVVGPVDDIDIDSAMVHATTNHGTTVNTTSFRVYSTDAAVNPDPDGPGNTTLYGVTFSASDLRNGNFYIPSANVEFVPAMIDSIKPAESYAVFARVNVPYGTYATTYSGIATATNNTGTTSDTVRIFVTVNPYYDLDIADNEQNLTSNKMSISGAMGTVHQRYFRMINPNSAELNIDPDIFGNADFTSFTYTVDTLRYIPFGNEDILYYIPPSAVGLTLPSGLASGASYNARVQVSIPMNTFTGVYRGKVTVRGVPNLNTYSDTFTLEVVVGPVDDIDITEPSVTGSGNQGTIINTTNFTVWSTDAGEGHNPDAYDGPGNTTLYGITFSSQDLIFGNFIIPAANVSFVPITIESLAPGQSRQVRAVVNIPFGVHNGVYSGLATATNNTGTTSDTVRIIVTVNPYYDLDIADNEQNLIGNKLNLSGPMGAVRQGRFRLVNPNSAELNVDPDQFGNADFTSLTATVDTLKYVPFGNEEILYYIPPQAVTITLPTEPAGLASGSFYDATASVNIPMNTFTGIYRGRVRITGTPGTPGTPSDTFILEVFVGPFDDLDIREASVSASTNHGTTVNTSTFRVFSTDAAHNPDPDGPGNTTLYGVTFSATDLRFGNLIIPAANIQFVPVTVDSIRPGDSVFVYARVNVPYGTHNGLYSGIATAYNNPATTSDTVRINVTVNAYYDLDIADNQQNLVSNKMNLAGPMGSTRQGFFRMVNPNNAEMNIDPDMFGNADFTNFTYSVDTLRFVAGGEEDILTYIPPSAVTLTLPTEPAGLVSGAMYDAKVTVNIPMNTLTGTYRGYVTVTGTPGEPGTPTDMFMLEVQVGPLEDLDIAEASVSASGNQSAIVTTTPFTVWSTDAGHNPDPDGPGNITLYGINFIAQDLRFGTNMIPASNIQFNPATITSLYPGTSAQVRANVTIPYGTYAGTYSGLVTAQNNTGSTNDTVRIYVTVNADYDLDIADNMAGLVTNKMTINLVPNFSGTNQFLLVNPDRPENNYDPDPYGNADLTGLQYRVSEILYSPDGYTLANSAITLSNNPTDLTWGAGVNVNVTATIDPLQPYATYYGYVTVYKLIYEQQLLADSFLLEVKVGPRDIFIMPDTITINGYAGSLADTSFVVTNMGNKTIERIELFMMTDFFSTGGVRIPMSALEFTPPILIDSMLIGEGREVVARVDIPRGALPTTYIAKAKAMQQRGDPAKNFVIKLNVLYQVDISDGIIVSDNPVTGAYVDIAVIGDAGTSPKLTIMNMAAEIVHTKTIEIPKYTPKTGGVEALTPSAVYRWMLVNDNGKGVASGLYVAILETKIEGKDKVFTKKILIVK